MDNIKNLSVKAQYFANTNPQAFRVILSLAITVIAAVVMGSPADAVKLAGPATGSTGGI